MPTPDAGPLAGVRVAVGGDDPALRHAWRLLTWLGAHALAHPAPAVLIDITCAPGSAADDWARSGAMMLTGRRDGPPLAAPGAPASAVRGALLVLEALTRARGGACGEPWPDVALLGERAAIAGLRRQGPVSAGGAYRPVRSADGWTGLSLPRPSDLELVPALVEGDIGTDAWAAVERWASARTGDEVVARARLLGLAAARIPATSSYDDRVRPIRCTRGGVAHRRSRPLVVDLTSLWAGPLCAHLLGLTGARVVKVESTRRPDGARDGPRPFFDLMHAGHRSVGLDLSTEGGRAALAALVRHADVVLEASRPRALRQLGIDAEAVVAGGTTWTSITAHGRAGAGADAIGFGDDVAADAGLVTHDAGVPMPCGDAIADPLAGVHAAVATAAALLSDRSWLLDVSMRDVAASTLAPVETTVATVAAQPVRARRATGVAAELGADTEAVLRELRTSS